MYKVVIVENENLIRKGLILTIDWEAMDAIVVGDAPNGVKGMQLILETQPDIVITDIRMPVMDGLEMIEALQEKNVSTEYIIVSGYNEFEYAQKAIRLGVVDFLLKPIDEEELAKSVKQIQKRITLQNDHEKLVHKIKEMKESPYMLFEKYFQDSNFDMQEGIIQRTIQYITENLSNDLTITGISDYLQVSAGHLSRSFKKATGHTVLEYITLVRMKKAVEFFEKKEYRISEVAYFVGFNDPKHFSNTFRKYIGVTPTEFRNHLN